MTSFLHNIRSKCMNRKFPHIPCVLASFALPLLSISNRFFLFLVSLLLLLICYSYLYCSCYFSRHKSTNYLNFCYPCIHYFTALLSTPLWHFISLFYLSACLFHVFVFFLEQITLPSVPLLTFFNITILKII